MKTAKEIFDLLPGEWAITRNIVSVEPLGSYEGAGRASFAKSQDTILYSEQLSMLDNTTSETFATQQKYQYQYDEKDDSLSKFYNDGRLLYKLDISEGEIKGDHLCIDDKYAASFHFADDDLLVITYSVRGPHKNYIIATKYTKKVQ